MEKINDFKGYHHLFFDFWVLGSQPVLRAYSYLCAQGLLLEVRRESYGVLRIEPELARHKAIALTTPV